MAAVLGIVLLGIAPPPSAADTTTPATISTRQAPPASQPAPATRVELQAYRGFGQDRHGSEGTPMRLDVTVELAGCADGNMEAMAVDAGGWRHEVAEGCTSAPTPATAEPGPDREQPAAAASPAGPPSIKPSTTDCDPATWNCRTTAR